MRRATQTLLTLCEVGASLAVANAATQTGSQFALDDALPDREPTALSELAALQLLACVCQEFVATLVTCEAGVIENLSGIGCSRADDPRKATEEIFIRRSRD